MRRATFITVLTLLLLNLVSAQAQLASGPMLTQLEMREATIWLQTAAPSAVRVQYSAVDAPETLYWSELALTEPDQANCARLTLDQVEPGKSYNYRVELAGSLSAAGGRFTSPEFFHGRSPAPDLRIAIGGAHYVNQADFDPPYQQPGGDYGIFAQIEAATPDLMLWVGNTAHLRPSDWRSASGYLKRYGTARALPELQGLLASTPHYATWGDSDYSPTRAGRHYSYRRSAEHSFRCFWPMPPAIESVGGIASHFSRSDVDFFLLDVRSQRDDRPDARNLPEILGSAQVDWLRNALIRSTATFKVIVAGAPILNPAENPENLSSAEREHADLLQMLRNEKISGLFFISGGKYYGELTRLVHASSYNLYDLTVGPLTATPQASNQGELNYFRMPRSSSFQRQFALIDFSGPEDDRQLEMRVLNSQGEPLWSRVVKASQLQPSGGR